MPQKALGGRMLGLGMGANKGGDEHTPLELMKGPNVRSAERPSPPAVAFWTERSGELFPLGGDTLTQLGEMPHGVHQGRTLARVRPDG